MPLSEFLIIEHFARRVSNTRTDVRVGIGDDGAIIAVPAGMELVVSMDTLVEGVHFFAGTEPRLIGYKALAVNLSDMAAMGAEPAWVTLGLTIPEPDAQWVESFADGFFSLANQDSLALIGGDVTRGPLTLTVQLHGLVPAGSALLRSGAETGDRIYVTGTLGDAGLGLLLAKQGKTDESEDALFIGKRLHQPTPRVETGVALRGIASSCIDLSDGLLADLGHVLDASGKSALIEFEKLPLSDAYERLANKLLPGQSVDRFELPLNAGDDYELCFTVPEKKHAELVQALGKTNVPYAMIGEIHEGSGIRCVKEDGTVYTPRSSGYEHFL